jgi:hypothetical protein
LQIKTKIVSCHTADSIPVKQEVNGTVILPPLAFPGSSIEIETPTWPHSVLAFQGSNSRRVEPEVHGLRQLRSRVALKTKQILEPLAMHVSLGSAITNGIEPRSCLGRVFNSKLGCIATLGNKCTRGAR